MAYDLGTAHGTIEIEYEGAKNVKRATDDMDKTADKSKEADAALKRLSATFKALGKGVAVGGLAVGITNAGVAAANLGVQLAGVVPQLASITSLSAALPGMFVAAAVSSGVLKAAMAGVGDAVKEAFNAESADKFNEAIKKLAPNAREFAKALRENAPALREVQQGIQNAFFENGFEALVPRLTASLKSLQPSLNGLAFQFGEIAQRTAAFALSAKGVGFVRGAVESLRTALDNAFPALQPLLNGLTDVGTVGLPLMERLGAAVGSVGAAFGEWLSEIAADGRLQEWIDTALATLKTLGGIASNVGSILTSVFQAAGETGGGLLGTIQEITGEFATFLKSAEGSAAIRALFTGIGDAARQLAPVFTTLVGALAGALGPALSDLATNIGPILLQVVQALAPAFAPLAQAIADVASAIAPSLPGIAQLVAQLVILGSGILSTLAANLQPVIELLGSGLQGVMAALAPVIEQVVAQLPMFAEAGLQLATALAPLIPSIIQFATALAQQLLPYLPQLMQSALQLVPPLIQLAQLFADRLAPALLRIIPYLPMIIGFLVQMQGVVLGVVGAILRFTVFLTKLGDKFNELPQRIASAMESFRNAVQNGFNRAIELARQFPFRVGQAIGVLLTILINTARNAWNGLRTAFNNGINTARNLASTLPGKIRNAIASLPSVLGSMARTAWNNLRNAFSNGVNTARGLASTLPGKIRSAIGNLGGLLVSAGAAAIRGLVNGIRGAIGSAISAAAAAGRAVINGIKSTLRISSPSRVMKTIGRFVTQGLVDGLTGTAKQVKAASTKLANYVRDAFSDGDISKKKRNSVLSTLSKGTKQLLSLVNKSNQVAAKLKSAQSALAAVKKQYDETWQKAAAEVRSSFSLIGEGLAASDVDVAKERFKQAVQQARDFAADIATLSKKGLNKDLIAQLVAAGVQGGGAMADALANSSATTIKEFNDLQSQLNSSANSVGKATADALYGAGYKAAQGLVKGLQSQQKAIEAQMLRIAKSMEKAIKKALKIKSPSRVMFNLGKFASEGLKLGIESLIRQVRAAAEKLAEVTIMPSLRLADSGAPAFSAPIHRYPQPILGHRVEAPTSFGPYPLMLDGKVISEFVIDAITGAPKIVAKSASEGDRQLAWSGSGRKAS